MLNYITVPVLFLVAADAKPLFKVQVAEAKRIEGVLTFEVHAARYSADEWIVVAAQAPQLPGQTAVTTKMEPAGVARQELGPLQRPIVVARLPAKANHLQKGFKVEVSYQATLRSRNLVPLKPGEKSPRIPPLAADTRQLLLAPSETLDFKSKEFQKWLDAHTLRRTPREGDLEFAQRVFIEARKTFTYQWPVPHDGKASSTCRARRGDCGCLSAVFVSALRANGIPARALVGRWAASLVPPRKPGAEPDYQTHVKAEFFAEGIGWVPVDQTQALDDKSPTGLRFFGHDPGDFLVQHVDFDVLVDTIHFGRQRCSVMQGIPYWTTGSGSLDGTKTHENWQVRTLRSKQS